MSPGARDVADGMDIPPLWDHVRYTPSSSVRGETSPLSRGGKEAATAHFSKDPTSSSVQSG